MSYDSAWTLLRQSVLSQSPPQAAPHPRALSHAEQQKVKSQLKESQWDEGKISTFLTGSITPRAEAYDLPCGATLLLFIPAAASASEAAAIAKEANALLTWLGAVEAAGGKFTIILFYRDDPRLLEAEEWPTRATVNGGWAVPGSGEILIYRAEEWDRVLLHETIHALEWDWDMPEKPLPCWGISGPGTIVSPHLFEAWTELYAEWLWCGWHNVPWEHQRAWQEEQAIQVLARSTGAPWKENTNIFAYYVLKAALAPHIAFLWSARNGITPAERFYVLCRLVAPELERLRVAAAVMAPKELQMRMTTPASKK